MAKKQQRAALKAPELTPEQKAEKDRLYTEARELDIEVGKAKAKERLLAAIGQVFSVFPPATNKRCARELSLLRASGAVAADTQPTWTFRFDFGRFEYQVENEAGSEGTIALVFETEYGESRASSMQVTTTMNWASHGSMPISHCVGVLSSHLRMAHQLAELEFILANRMGIQAGLGGRGIRAESFRRAAQEIALEGRQELERAYALHTAAEARSGA